MGNPGPRPLVLTRASGPGVDAYSFRRRVNSGRFTELPNDRVRSSLAGIRPLVATRASGPGADAYSFRKRVNSSMVTVVSSPSSRERISTSL